MWLNKFAFKEDIESVLLLNDIFNYLVSRLSFLNIYDSF